MSSNPIFLGSYPKQFKPMLAYKKKLKTPQSEFLEKIWLPAWETPKIDGIRGITFDLPGPTAQSRCTIMSRQLKAIRNTFISEIVGEMGFPGMDGELIVLKDHPDDPNNEMWAQRILPYYECQSQIMAYEGHPRFVFVVFDFIVQATRCEPYKKRL